MKFSRAGFSLLEISIVMVLIAVVTTMGISAGNNVIESAKVAGNSNRIRTVEGALLAYRKANNRLPCPADGALATSNANYGYESGAAGTCTANFNATVGGGRVVEGVVPVRTLNLPDEYMYDGWGRKVGYAVASVMTGANAFVDYGASNNCGLITVKNTSGGATRTSAADYVLISYGPDGHGAYNSSGSKVSYKSANTDEQLNCHCNSSAVDTGYAATYVAKEATQNPANTLDNFDDIVIYKERFQMRNYYDEFNLGGNLLCPNANPGIKIVGANPGDNFGWFVVTGDVNGDGVPDLIVGAPITTKGTVYVFFGSLNGFQSIPTIASLDGTNGFVINGAANGDGVNSLAVGDVNGDGIADIVIGQPAPNSTKGSVYVIFGKKTGWPASINLATDLTGANGFRINGVVAKQEVGYGVTVGDVNDDGYGDILISAPGNNSDMTTGNVYVVYGAATWSYATYTLDNTVNTGLIDTAGSKGFKINEIASNDFPDWVRAVDINGDGIPDIVIGSQLSNGTAGGVYVLYGHKSNWINPFNLSSLDGNNGFMILGPAFGGNMGTELDIGDINGDGINDMVIGAALSSYHGAQSGSVHVVFGKTAKWPKMVSLYNMSSNTGFRLDGVSGGDYFGHTMAVGDFNGDGIADVVIGAREATANGQGAAGKSYVIFGKKSAWASTATVSSLMDGTQGFELDGSIANEHSGWIVGVGDLNGDGKADFVLGTFDASGGNGGVYIYFGQRASSWSNPVNLGNLP